ncbi:translocator protein isoform X1 [Gracilaria domingensis]|nr:translocator protein isoform X1 [Gracilaria domingensis]
MDMELPVHGLLVVRGVHVQPARLDVAGDGGAVRRAPGAAQQLGSGVLREAAHRLGAVRDGGAGRGGGEPDVRGVGARAAGDAAERAVRVLAAADDVPQRLHVAPQPARGRADGEQGAGPGRPRRAAADVHRRVRARQAPVAPL